MKKYIGILIILALVGASTSVCGAGVYLADTPDYNDDDGKILLVYGNSIKEVHLTLRDLENTSTAENYHFTNLTGNTYMRKMYNPIDARFVRYDVLVYDSVNNTYTFTGVYATFGDDIDFDSLKNDIEDLINTSNEAVKNDLQKWMLKNQSWINFMDGFENAIVAKVSDYNDGLVDALKKQGLSKSQIADIKNTIEVGFNGTLESKNEVDLRVAQAKEDGWNDAMKLVGIFVFIIVLAFALWFFTKKDAGFPFFKKKRRTTEPASDDFDFDMDVFG